jgi:hypothetical protein
MVVNIEPMVRLETLMEVLLAEHDSLEEVREALGRIAVLDLGLEFKSLFAQPFISVGRRNRHRFGQVFLHRPERAQGVGDARLEVRRRAVGDERAVRTKLALCNHPATLAKQVRSDAAESHRRARALIDDRETDGDTVFGALDRADLDHSAQPHRFAMLGLAGGDIDRRIEIGGAVLQTPYRQKDGNERCSCGQADQNQPLMLGTRDHRRLSCSA